MNRRKNTKSMWSKFTSPSNHSATNLLIEPASSTTKLLRGNRSMGGCDNHSYYAATGKELLFFRRISPLQNWSFTGLNHFEFSQWIYRNSYFSLETAAIIPAAARTASAHGSTSAQTTQQIYGASNVVAGRSSPGTLTGTSAAALSFAAMEQMHIQNRLYSA